MLTQVSHESLQPDMDGQAHMLLIIVHVVEYTMGSCTMQPETHFLADEDNISDVMRMTSRIKLTLLNLTIEHLNLLTMAKYYVMVILNYCVPNAQDFTCALFVTLVTHSFGDKRLVIVIDLSHRSHTGKLCLSSGANMGSTSTENNGGNRM